MKYTRWISGTGCDTVVSELMDAGYPYLVSSVLQARGVENVEDAALFLSRDHFLEHSPFLMRKIRQYCSIPKRVCQEKPFSRSCFLCQISYVLKKYEKNPKKGQKIKKDHHNIR